MMGDGDEDGVGGLMGEGNEGGVNGDARQPATGAQEERT